MAECYILLTVHHILFPEMMVLLQLSAGGKPLSQFGTGGRRGENGPQFLFLLKNSVYILLILWASILSDADLFQPVVDGR